jgi:virulence-associated protein VapD
MTFRLTTLERAYQLAESGSCRTVGDIKQALQAEGYERIQDSLYGATLSAALRKLCQANYVAPVEAESDAG